MGSDPTGPTRGKRVLQIFLLALAICGAAVWLWYGALRYRFVAKRFGEVTPIVHRSGQISEHMIGPVIEAHGIRRIVDLTEAEFMPEGKIKEREIAKEKGIEVLNFPLVGDGTGDVELYAKAVAAVIESERRGESVLVHCAAGTYRTGGVVACFRILYQGWTIDEAMRECEDYNWNPEERKMPEYLEANLPKIRAYLVEWGTLPAEDASKPNSPAVSWR
jgi:protein-tyrosine phosphatase